MASAIVPIFRRNFARSAKLLKEIEYGSATAGDHGAGEAFWKKMSYFVAVPACVLTGISCYLDQISHHPERPEFHPYEHMRIRTKKFPWGDGNHTLFHNPHFNALPDGYEEEL